jgi:hypothetical protein
VLVALAGLALVALGPAALVVAWRDHAAHLERAQAQETYRVGDPVSDGPVTFVVHEVRCGAAPEEETTHGQLCEVTLGARNDGEEAVRIPGGAQILRGSLGARHQPTRAGATLLGTLEPRQAATAVLQYDLPLHSTVTHVEVRADTYSRGIPVAVGAPYPLVAGD